MFLKLWNYIRGYVVIKLSGFNAERFINLAANKGIYMWDAARGADGVYVKVSAKGFKSLRSCARKSKTGVKITKKTGVPFFIYKHRKRKIFVLGFFFFIFSLYFLSSFIWLVETQGNDRIHQDKIIEFFAGQNIRVGGFKRLIDKKEAEKLFLREFPDASWVNVSIKGTRATVKITETLPKQQIVLRGAPCDIVASKDGIITSIVTSSGTPLKKENDIARKGEVIVSGELISGEDMIKSYTHAEAAVVAKTYYGINFFMPFVYEDKVYTNRSRKYYGISLLGKKVKINFPKSRITYGSYDKITYRNQLQLSDLYPLPVIFITEEYREFKPVLKRYTVSQAKSAAERVVSSRIINEFDFGIDVVDKRVSYNETEDGLEVSAQITALERIDRKEEMGS